MEQVGKPRSDMLLVMLLLVTLGVGVALLFSSSYSFASRAWNDPFYLVKRQLIWAALGGAAAFVLSLTPLELFRRTLPLLLLATLVAALLPFLPGLGTSVLGSRRWISAFGLSFQPSELVKVTLVLYLASYFARREEKSTVKSADKSTDFSGDKSTDKSTEYRGDYRGAGEKIGLNALIPPFIVIFVFSAVVLLQNDYSTAIFILVTGLAMLFIARVRILHFLLVSLLTVPLSFLLLFTREHRVQRLLAFLDLSSYRSGTGYQIINAKAALASGGLWGRGLGRSAAKLGPLPMSHSDFIYAIIGEETGLLGSLFVLALFVLLAWRGYQIAYRTTDRFSSYVAFGMTTAICLQAFLNMAVAVGLVPTTGVTLPFFSAGGSSLFVTLIMCGILVNLSRGAAHV
jgi:cell division protein FtsW